MPGEELLRLCSRMRFSLGRLPIHWTAHRRRILHRGGNEAWRFARIILPAVVAVNVALAARPATAQHHHEPPENPLSPLPCDVMAGEACFYGKADGALVDPSTTNSVGEIYLTLSSDRKELRYMIVLDDLLGLKPNLEDRIEPDDIVGIHIHIHEQGAIGPHVLNIFGWSTPTFWGQEDDDLVIDYENHTLTGIYDISDATIDPVTGEPYFPFFFATTKVIDDYLVYLETNQLVLAVHTNESGFAKWALHGHISSAVPEPACGLLLVMGLSLIWVKRARVSRFAIRSRYLPFDS